MKTSKLIISIIMVCSLVVWLTACGSQNETSNTVQADGNKSSSDYPKKPVTLMLSYAAGGATDIFMREFSSVAEKHLGQKIIIKNETGGGGMTANNKLAKVKPDGYTLGMAGTTLYAVNPYLELSNLSPEDFTTISSVIGYQYVLFSKSDAPFNNFEELVEYSKNNTVKVGVSSTNNAVFAELINQEENFELNWDYVRYNGSGESAAAVLGDHVDIALEPPASMLGSEEAGDLRFLVTFNEDGLANLPHVPTLKEEGVDLTVTAVGGIAGPAGLSEEVISVWEDVIEKTMKDPKIQEVAEKLNFDLVYMNEEEANLFFENQKEQYGGVIDRVIE